MSRLPRPCLGATNPNTHLPERCGVPTTGSRCPRHAAMHEAGRRPSPSVRGYDEQYKRERAELLDERPLCELRLPGCTGVATTADHPVALAAGGDRRQALVPACASCNSRKGAR